MSKKRKEGRKGGITHPGMHDVDKSFRKFQTKYPKEKKGIGTCTNVSRIIKKSTNFLLSYSFGARNEFCSKFGNGKYDKIQN